jgi:UDP-N-acetylglucosamine--N-acetylmuramyl-(pentapeptide) pyrophosphoryl-undecaprenol N-acetylglucosamine transferase
MLPFKLIKSFYQVRRILRVFKPDAVIGVGGYSSFPVLRLAQTKNIPTFIHESNSYAGKSNKLLAKKATKIFVASYGMEKFFPADKLLMTGNPIRNIFSKPILRKEALNFFGLKEGLKTVLVVGGSLCAGSINEAIKKNIHFFRENKLQLIWQTGKDFAKAAATLEEEDSNIWTGAFIDNMPAAYAAADYVVSRSGAMAVSELCVVGRPVIFVPYPHAAEDHQTANANALVQNKAALLVKDGEVQTGLTEKLRLLINQPGLAEEMKLNITKYGNTNADVLIATEILKQINA